MHAPCGKELWNCAGHWGPQLLCRSQLHVLKSHWVVVILKCLVQLTFLHFLIELPSEGKRSELRKCKLVLTATFVTLLVCNTFQELETSAPLVDVSTAAARLDCTGVKHRTTEIQLKCYYVLDFAYAKKCCLNIAVGCLSVRKAGLTDTCKHQPQ